MIAKVPPMGKRPRLTLVLVLVIALGAFGLAVSCSNDEPARPPSIPSLPPEPTNAIIGDGSHFDPISTYPDIAKFAGDDLQLSSIHFYFVRSDGTLDLNAKYQPHVYYYFFQRMDGRPADAPPVGAGGKLNEKWYQPVSVDIRARNRPGERLDPQRSASQPTNTTQQAIPAPSCSLQRLWSVALAQGAPKDAVATIDYDARGYSFRISDTSVSLTFDNQCQYLGGTGLTPEPTETRAP
jgi:hypothetical protein